MFVILQELLFSAFLTDQFFIASHSHLSRLDYAYFTKRPPLNEAAKRLDKLSSWEPKASSVIIFYVHSLQCKLISYCFNHFKKYLL